MSERSGGGTVRGLFRGRDRTEPTPQQTAKRPLATCRSRLIGTTADSDMRRALLMPRPRFMRTSTAARASIRTPLDGRSRAGAATATGKRGTGVASARRWRNTTDFIRNGATRPSCPRGVTASTKVTCSLAGNRRGRPPEFRAEAEERDATTRCSAEWVRERLAPFPCVDVEPGSPRPHAIAGVARALPGPCLKCLSIARFG
jgi:hypothetical protein